MVVVRLQGIHILQSIKQLWIQCLDWYLSVLLAESSVSCVFPVSDNLFLSSKKLISLLESLQVNLIAGVLLLRQLTQRFAKYSLFIKGEAEVDLSITTRISITCWTTWFFPIFIKPTIFISPCTIAFSFFGNTFTCICRWCKHFLVFAFFYNRIGMV